MKKMILRAVLLLLAVLAVPLALLITAFAIPAQFSKTYYGELPAMYDRLRDAEGHKIVLVGSSGLAFGVDPDLLDAEFPDYTVCPFGLYGTIGTETMMDLSKAHISEGDLVILAPEQGAQTYSMYFNGGEVWLATDGRPDIAARLPFGEYANMAESLPAFLARKYRCFTVDGAPEPSGVYAKSSFNESCALIYDRPYNIMDGGFNPQDPISYDPGIAEEAFLDYVNEYNDWVTKKGATLLFAFPPVNKASIEGGLDEAAVRRFYDFLDEELECPLLGNPLDSVMEAEWFYDSNVHLNTPGSVAFTKTLAETLKAYLGDTSPVHIDVPDMPPLPGRDPAEGGEDADAAYFTYEETDGGLRITGLTAEGRARTALTIPAQYNG
ncbi:MAG: hypothetical protein J6U26_01180, partial [Lachnospiraceae bacterium]|nr:hypothetical protein [Lachnospiraceae bacterium]